MKNKFQALLSFFGALVFVLTGALALPASADTANPVVVAGSGTLSPTSAGPGASITATWRVTDDTNCCDFHRIHVIPEGMGTFDAVAYFDNMTFVSGTGTDGTYSKTFNLPNAISAGIYDIRVQVTDKAGKFSDNTTVAKLTVTGNSQTDLQNPVVVLDSGTVSKTSVLAGESLTVTWQVTDDLDCCDFNRVNFVTAGNPSNDVLAFFDTPSRILGDGKSGTYSKTFSAPNLAPGNYDLRVQVTDKAGKYSNMTRVAVVTIATAQPTDSQNPVVIAGSGVLSPATANPGATISATWRVTDDVACCDFHRIHVIPEGMGTFDAVAYFDGISRVSGTDKDATYSKSFSLPTTIAPGVYDIRVQVTDKAGKFSDNTTVAKLTVQSRTDTQNPVLIVGSGTVSKPEVKQGEQLTVTWRITDDVGCCDFNRINIIPQGADNSQIKAFFSSATRISGTATDGIYSRTFTVPTNLEPGVYSLRVQATDLTGKYTRLDEVATVTVTLATGVDRANPVVVLDSGTISSSNVKAGDTVTATWRVTDDLGCCDFHRIHIIPKGKGTWDAIIWYDGMTQVSGTATDGTYRKSFTMPQAPAGDYELWVWVTDKAGKYSSNTRVASFSVGAVTDTQNPVVVVGSGTVSSSQVRAGEQLTVTWRVTDDLDCCDFNRINIMPQGADNSQLRAFFDGAIRVSGDGKNGTYSKTFVVPTTLAAGNYSLRAQATDKAGKYTRLDEVATFSVVSATDAANPVVVAGSGVVFPASAAPGEKVTLLYQVTDDLDCCNPHDAYMYDSLGNWVVRNQAVLVSGTKTNATYRVEFTLPRTLSAGTYTFKSQVTDKAGKFSQLQELGSVRVSAQDAQNPVIVPESAVLSNSSLTTGDVLTVSYQATDDLGGFAPHDAFVYDANNNLVLRAPAARVSGDALRATFRASFNLGEQLVSGEYTVRSQVTDNAGKYSNLQLLGRFSFTSQAQQRLEIVQSTGLASPSVVQPGSVVRISFTLQNDSGDVSARALVQDSTLRTLATGSAVRLFRGIGSSQYYADVRVPTTTTTGSYFFAANVVDNKTGFSSNANFGTFVVQAQPTQLEAPRNLRFVDGGGLSPSTLIWDAPNSTSSNPIISYTAQALTNDGTWNNFCSSDAVNRSCYLYNRTINGKTIVAYRVAAVGSQGAGSYGSISQPASLAFVGDPIVSPATQPVAIPSSAVLNIGTFNKKIVVYAKGMKGATLSWKIAGKWQKATVTKDFQFFDRPTQAIGLRVNIELYVNGNKPAAFTKSVVTK